MGFYKEAMRRIAELPGVERVAVGTVVPWRDAGSLRPRLRVLGGGPRRGAGRRRSARAASGRSRRVLRGARRADHRRTRFQRRRSPRRRAGGHRQPEPGAADVPEPGCGEPPPDVDRSGHEVHRRQHRRPRRIVGVAADVDDENVVPGPAMTVYHPFEQEQSGAAACSFTRTRIRTRWCRRSRASSARCRRTSRWSARRRSKTSAPKCSRRIG